jgi:hypothetical protein
MATLVEQVGTELAAVHPILEPQIAGVERFLATGPPDPSMAAPILAVFEQLTRRRDLIQAMENARTALLADGYPELAPVLVPASVYQALLAVIEAYRIERDRGLSEFAAASKHFGPTLQATDLGLTAGATTPKA